MSTTDSRVPLDHLPTTAAPVGPPAGAASPPPAAGSVPPCAPAVGGTDDIAIARLSYDERIDQRRTAAEQLHERAVAASRAYDRAVLDRCDVAVLDDASFVKLQAAIDAAAATYRLELLLDTASATTGRPR